MNLATMLRGSRSGEKIAAELGETSLAARRRLVAEIELLRTSTVQRGNELAQANSAAQAKVAAAASQLTLARTAADVALIAFSSFDMGKNLGIARLENELRATAPARIDEVIHSLREAWERARHLQSGQGHLDGNRRVVTRCEAIMDAIAKTQALKLMALTPEELEAELAAIDAAIPQTFG